MYIEQLADKTRYYKETQEGVSYMCKAIEDMRKEAEERKAVKIALKLLALGTVSIEDIAKTTDLSLEDVQELAASVNKPA